MSIIMEVIPQRRRAEVTTNELLEKYTGVPAGIHKCHVLGLFQRQSIADYSIPVFVCELDDGRCFSTGVENVRFVDTEGGFIRE